MLSLGCPARMVLGVSACVHLCLCSKVQKVIRNLTFPQVRRYLQKRKSRAKEVKTVVAKHRGATGGGTPVPDLDDIESQFADLNSELDINGMEDETLDTF